MLVQSEAPSGPKAQAVRMPAIGRLAAKQLLGADAGHFVALLGGLEMVAVVAANAVRLFVDKGLSLQGEMGHPVVVILDHHFTGYPAVLHGEREYGLVFRARHPGSGTVSQGIIFLQSGEVDIVVAEDHLFAVLQLLEEIENTFVLHEPGDEIQVAFAELDRVFALGVGTRQPHFEIVAGQARGGIPGDAFGPGGNDFLGDDVGG